MGYDPVEYWNQRATNRPTEWDGRNDLNPLVGWCRETFSVSTPPTILEVGSGNGRLLRALRKYKLGERMSMCDISEEYRKLCFMGTGILPAPWDGETLPYLDGMFDLVVAHDVLIHVLPERIEKVWNELVRVTSKYLYVSLSEDLSKKEKEKFNISSYCFLHDYRPLLEKTSMEIIKEEDHPKRATAGKAILWFLEKRSS